MASAIGPGDWVERSTPSLTLTVGSIWQVAAIGYHTGDRPHCSRCAPGPTPWVRLVGEPPHPDPRPFCACGFRPIYRPKQSIIEALKAPPKQARKPARENA